MNLRKIIRQATNLKPINLWLDEGEKLEFVRIKEAHDIVIHVENVMMKDHGVYDVHVHVEPKLIKNKIIT